MPGLKIIYLKHSDIDKSKWNDCINNSPNGIVYAYSWYLDIVCPDWDALVENEYESVFPLTKNKKYGIEYLFPPFFTQQLGLFSKNKITKEKLYDFLISISNKFNFIEINLNAENNFVTPGFLQKKNLTHLVTLNLPYDKIQANYNENLKRNLKKATQYNQKIIYNADPKEIIKLFRKNRGKEISKLKEQHYNTLLRIVDETFKRKMIKIYGVENENGRLVAGAFFLEARGKSIFIFSGSNQEAKEKLSMPLLIDSYIRQNAEKNLILDFEGSNNLNLARFYKSFGAKEVVYLQIKKNSLPFPLKLFKK